MRHLTAPVVVITQQVFIGNGIFASSSVSFRQKIGQSGHTEESATKNLLEQMDNLIPHCRVESDKEDDGRGDLSTDNLDLCAELGHLFHASHKLSLATNRVE